MRWKWMRWTLVEVCLAWTLMLTAGWGQIATTTVADTIYEANGTAASGTVLISWPAFSSFSGTSVPAGSTAVTLGSGGSLSVALVPNAGSNPIGSYYTVVYHLGDGSSAREYWVVPTSASAVKLAAIRSTVLPTSVAMQTVSKAYVDTAIAAALGGGPPISSAASVSKAGDTMTGPLVLPGDPTVRLQAADKHYVDAQVAANAGLTLASLPVFGASGSAHARGVVPDPGSTPGTTRFLREDGTWVVGGGNPAVASASGYTTTGPNLLPQRSHLLAEYLLSEGSGIVAHDTSGQGNDGTLGGTGGGPTWEGATDLNFTALGQYVQLPSAVNSAKAWQFAIYSPPFGTLTAPQPTGYGFPTVFGANPTVLCGTDLNHLCLIAGSPGKSLLFRSFTTDQTGSAVQLTAGWHVVSFLCGSNVGGFVTKTKILYDGSEVGGYSTQGDAGTCPNPTSGNYQLGGSSALTGTWFLGKIAAAWAWSTTLTVNDGAAAAKSALDFIKSKGVLTDISKAPHPTPLILAGIDSRTYGVGVVAGQDWPTVMTLNDSTFTRLNLGVPGELVSDGCSMFEATYGSQLSPGQGQVITMLWGGVNDYLFSSQSSRQIANSLECMVQKAKATGSKVVVATEISSESPSGPTGDNGKNGLNTIVRAEAFGWGADSIADLATDVHLGADGASSNTTCFPDALHPSAACEPYITAIMQNAVNELMGSTERNRNATAAASYQEVAADDFLDLTGSAAQTVTLPDCTGYSRTRQMVNLGTANATVGPVSGQTLVGSTAVAVGARAFFVPIPGALATGGCHWERTQ